MLIRSARILGQVLLAVGVLFIATSLLATWYFHGFSKLQEVMSPFNIWQYILTAIILAPGLFLLWLSEKLSERRPQSSETHR